MDIHEVVHDSTLNVVSDVVDMETSPDVYDFNVR